jgi:DNA invertase Pin-like site-specific DNA recombinase
MSKGQRVGYRRVSSGDQSTERQLEGVALDKEFEDKASGKESNRPGLSKAIEYVREGDTLIVHSLDRLARNVEDLLRTVRGLNAKGVTVEFVKERLTFTGGSVDPMANLMMAMLGAFAEFERSLIRERQREGIALAKARGIYVGRKPSLTDEQVAQVKARVAAGERKVDVARAFGVSRETLYAYLRPRRKDESMEVTAVAAG